MSRNSFRLIACAFLCSTVLGGCASSVQPWEREILAKEAMTDTQNLRSSFENHLFFSKEANAGGGQVAGGGCGCN